MNAMKSKRKPVKKMRYHKVPMKWRPELHRYVLEYIQSNCTLSIREYCRVHGVKQGVFKRYVTKPLVDWMVCTLLSIKSIDEELEQCMGRISRDDLGVYKDLF